MPIALSNKIRNSLLFSVIIVITGVIPLYLILHANTDGVKQGVAIFFYSLVIIISGGSLGILFLLIDIFNISTIRKSRAFNFVSTLNFVIGLTGFIISFIWKFDSITNLIPFTICLFIGLLMFFRIDK